MSRKELTPEQIESAAQDHDVIRQVLAGDKDAYKFLQKKYTRLITSAVRRVIQKPSDVEDLVQETFIKAYLALTSYRAEYSFSAWLYRIASNACIDYLRKRRLPTFSIDKPVSGHDGGEYFVELPDLEEVADRKLMSDEKKKILDDAIAALPDKFRIVMKLRHEDDLDYQQIAETLDLPIGTVKAHLFRARKRLYDQLKQHEHHFFD
ncbi:MAG TPA: sigma-70 family RNA polymerase sigma factor [Candidatus Kapabacteria bacterium]|jgi:RNA polymerase sigma factor (sigma-70 family)|nr:sigma-70 family RNA polymerase sigma factor [Ignavibacteria bacterium]HRE58089.1 sigma-70 family RNA polymerase sigma factor [Candidatus Kapabacteria bacterium]HRK60064.1 sigma-70 family RNA polymerase sigma factor [Candidatus Kapabacteria bacterium]